jgi:transcriptional regulator with XRE-family HTH domain
VTLAATFASSGARRSCPCGSWPARRGCPAQVERGLRQPSARILKDIAKALRISAETLYVRAGILDEETDPTDLEVGILRDPHLTERQKQVLIEVYRSFRAEGATAPLPR